MKKNKYEKLMYKSEKLTLKSLKANSDKRRWRLQDKADKFKAMAYALNLEEV